MQHGTTHRTLSRFSRSPLPACLAAFAALAVFVACGDDDDPMGNGSTGNLSDPDVFEAAMQELFEDGAEGVIDGIERLFVAIEGGPADGVILVPTSDGASATVSIDLDGDGTRESAVAGAFAGTLETGAQVTITTISVPSIPSLVASGNGRVTGTGPTTVLLDMVSGVGSADPPGSGNAADVSISNAAVGLDLATGTPNGFFDFVVTGEGESLLVDATFEPDGGGGWRTRFEGDGFDFTVP